MLEARFSIMEAQLVGQDERINQFKNQIDGLEGLIFEKSEQIKGYDEEIAAITILVEQELAAKSRLIALDRA